MQARDIIRQFSLQPHPEGGWYREIYRLDTPGAAAEPVAVAGSGVWQAARSLGEYSLAGCSVGPGFELADFRFVCTLAGHERHFEQPLNGWEALL